MTDIEALELARRVTASDVSTETLDRLERAADTMAMAYATTPPEQLLSCVRRHLDYIGQLTGARKTLTQHRRLLVTGGWFALLRATLHIDLGQSAAADAYLHTAAQLAEQTGHAEIAAWCLETCAWHVLTGGDFRQAVQLSQHAQAVAPAGGSAIVQATAQEGRAWARLGVQEQTRRVLDAVERLADHRAQPEHPEHHYQYDPAKAHAYAATTLAWAGDPAAEAVARDVIAELQADGARPRRVASDSSTSRWRCWLQANRTRQQLRPAWRSVRDASCRPTGGGQPRSSQGFSVPPSVRRWTYARLPKHTDPRSRHSAHTWLSADQRTGGQPSRTLDTFTRGDRLRTIRSKAAGFTRTAAVAASRRLLRSDDYVPERRPCRCP
jgi:hypothetical protein